MNTFLIKYVDPTKKSFRDINNHVGEKINKKSWRDIKFMLSTNTHTGTKTHVSFTMYSTSIINYIIAVISVLAYALAKFKLTYASASPA